MKKKILGFLLSLALVLSLIPAAAFAATSTNPSSKFKDVSKTAWYVPYINYVLEKGLMAGTSERTFEPDGTVTRAQYVQVLYALAKKPAVKKDSGFKDLRKNAYYVDAVNWAASAGVTKGVSPTAFGPNQPVTREQAATFFRAYTTKVARRLGMEESALDSYPDVKQISGYASDAMKWAVGSGLISGVKSKNKNYLQPKGSLTRAQLATMLKAFDGYLNGTEEQKEQEEKDYSYIKDGTISKGEWISMLLKKMEIEIPEDSENLDYFFSDTTESEHGKAIEVANGLGFLPEPVLEDAEQDVPEFHPDDPATREFAAYTAVRAMGFDGTHSFEDLKWSDLDEVQYKDEAQIAVHFNFLTTTDNKFNPGKPISKKDAISIFRGMDALDSSADLEEEDFHDRSVVAEKVIRDELSGIKDYKVSDKHDGAFSVTLPNNADTKKLKSGDVILLPKNEKNPNGIAVKVSKAQAGKNGVVITGQAPAPEEVFTEIDVAGVGTADVENVETPEGVSYKYDPNGVIEDDSETQTLELQKLDKHWSFEVPGTLDFTIKKIPLGDKGSVSGNVEISIPDITTIVKGHAAWGELYHFDEFTFKMQGKIKTGAKLEYKAYESGYEIPSQSGGVRKIEQHKEFARIPIPISTSGLSVDVIFYINVSLKGTVSITYTVNPTLGYQYINGAGRFIHEFYHTLDAIEAKGSASVGVGMEFALNALKLMDLAGIEAELGPAVNASFTVHTLTQRTMYCGDLTLYLYAKCGLSKSTAVGKFLDEVCHLTIEKEILENDKENPLKIKGHLENGKLVRECTFGAGRIEGLVRKLDDHTPIQKARICIYNDTASPNQPIRTIYTNAEGKFEINNLDADNYKLVISATGFYTYTVYNTEVTNGVTKYVETQLMVNRTGSDASGSIDGSISDAMTGEGISGAKYTIRTGSNNVSGQAVATGTFDADTFSMAMGVGNYTLEVSKTGYVTNSVNFAVGEGRSTRVDVILSADNQSGDNNSGFRVVLTWGDNPSDLDSHLFAEPDKYHVYYQAKNATGEENETANLDYDYMHGNGHETITVKNVNKKYKYSFYVHDYTNRSSQSSNEMGNSTARVQFYVNGRVYTFDVPSKEGTVWHVFDYDPVTGDVTPVNTFSYSSDPGTLQ